MAQKDDDQQPEPEDRPDGPRDPSGDPDLASMEGPDVETPTGRDAEEAFSPEDLSFLEDVSAGTAAGSTAPTDTVDEHLADLKRVSAEYANYRRRTEANRQLERDRAVGDVVKFLLPVLDDLDRAEKHGDLTEGGPLTTIAQKLRTSVEKIGLVPFGEAGESFDPAHHEALFQKPNSEVTAPTVADVVERGYRIGDVTLRAAKVVVDTPAD